MWMTVQEFIGIRSSPDNPPKFHLEFWSPLTYANRPPVVLFVMFAFSALTTSDGPEDTFSI